MFTKIIFIIYTLNSFRFSSETIVKSQNNETNLFLLLNSQLSELRAEQERQGMLMDGHFKESDQCNVMSYPSNCAEAKSSGIHEILVPNFSSESFKVACDAETQEGGWLIILRRMDGSEIFYRSWNAYKRGFGNLDGEFFLGLDKIHALTTEDSQELLVIVEDFEGDVRFELYERFGIAGEDEQYALNTLGKANGTAGDSLVYHHGMKFTTFDRDNDNCKGNCAEYCTGAWWYNNYHYSNLAGKYNDNTLNKGVIWDHFRGSNYSLKRAVMMIRPKKSK
ncbi:ficolin-1-like [Drosophila innubila]|uniref:ficolin-1-like n=1 Tax=Drosophila innubila TaxID=198719 RepID=UPI00148C8C9F|nr:ficolin-1-like [Drosophila innubila]